MELRDEKGSRSRLEAVRRLWDRHQRQIGRLKEKYQVRAFRFGRALGPLDSDEPPDQATAIGDCLAAAAKSARGTKPAGIVLFSDGANNSGVEPEEAATSLWGQEAPVYTFCFGKTEAGDYLRDVKALSIKCTDPVFTDNVLVVSGRFTFVRCEGKTITVSLKFDGKVIEAQALRISSKLETQRVEFRYIPKEPGPHKVALAAAKAERELVTGNNQVSTFVTVLAGGLRVLYLDGKVRAERKFIKRALETAEEITIACPLSLSLGGNAGNVPLPRKPSDWRKLHAIVIGDVPRKFFSAPQLEAIRDSVANWGLGFAMIGGFQNFGPGGYGGTPIADLLPVKVAAGDEQHTKLCSMKPTKTGVDHPILRLKEFPEANERTWRELPELDGCVVASGVKPGGTVLATTEAKRPLLVVQQYGKGRTAAIMADTTWRWVLTEKDTAQYHRRFWQQFVLWLCGSEKAGRERVWIELGKHRFLRAERVDLNVHAADAKNEPIADAEGRATVALPDGASQRVALRYDADRGVYEGVLFPQIQGDYVVTAEVSKSGKMVGTDEASFTVRIPDLELESPEARPQVLQRIARVSGGEHYARKDFKTLLDLLHEKEAETKIERRERTDLWDKPLTFYIFLAALVAEWLLRKKMGLV